MNKEIIEQHWPEAIGLAKILKRKTGQRPLFTTSNAVASVINEKVPDYGYDKSSLTSAIEAGRGTCFTRSLMAHMLFQLVRPEAVSSIHLLLSKTDDVHAKTLVSSGDDFSAVDSTNCRTYDGDLTTVDLSRIEANDMAMFLSRTSLETGFAWQAGDGEAVKSCETVEMIPRDERIRSVLMIGEAGTHGFIALTEAIQQHIDADRGCFPTNLMGSEAFPGAVINSGMFDFKPYVTTSR